MKKLSDIPKKELDLHLYNKGRRQWKLGKF